MAKVAFIGLGVMGYPMAGHLRAKGHDVTVYNRTVAKAAAWVAEHGGLSAPTPRAAALGQDIVFSCVGNDDDLRQVTIGSDGAPAGVPVEPFAPNKPAPVASDEPVAAPPARSD